MDAKVVESLLLTESKEKAAEKLVLLDEEHFLAQHGDVHPSESHPEFAFVEMKGDLFESKDSLVHCVSEEFAMSKGIALGFKERFGGKDELLAQNVKSGGVAFLKREDRVIYYMVTKRCYWQKPSYDNVWKSLLRLSQLCEEHGVQRLSMPIIACGLDRLRWRSVKEMIHRAFEKQNIKISVYKWE